MLSLILIAALAAPPEASPSRQATPIASETVPGWSAGALEIGALGGYAVGTVIDAQRTPTEFAQILVRLGVHFGAIGSGRRRGNFAIVAEGVGISVDQQPRAAGGGINLLVRYTWLWRRWRPSLLGGAGVVFTDTEVPPGETRHNFSPQVGVGLAYMLRPGWSLGGEYRFHHLSNKGATETNPGVNSHLLLLGVSWYPGAPRREP